MYQGPRAPTEFASVDIAGDYDSADDGALGGWAFFAGGGLMFSETMHDWGRAHSWMAQEQDTTFSYAAAHELGHQFGARHKGNANMSVMQGPFWSDPDGDYEFEEVTLLQFRRYVESPGQRPTEAE